MATTVELVEKRNKSIIKAAYNALARSEGSEELFEAVEAGDMSYLEKWYAAEHGETDGDEGRKTKQV